MIVVRVELHSAITGRVSELARMEITNDGERSTENRNRGDYKVRTLQGRSKSDLDKRRAQRIGMVLNHARLSEHVWNLVAKALKAMCYGDKTCNSTSMPQPEPTSSASLVSTKT